MRAEETTARPIPDLPSLGLASTGRAPLPMVTVEGATHVVRFANPAFCRLLEKPMEQLAGKPFRELLPEEKECVTVLDRVFRTGMPERFTEQAATKPRTVMGSYLLWPVMEAEHPVGVIMQVIETPQFHEKILAMNEALLVQSIRQHEQAEAAEILNAKLRMEIADRQRAEEALRESEERYRSLFDAAPMAMFACDRSSVIHHYNLRAVELWGREPVCGVEQHCGSVRLWLPDGTLMPHDKSPIVEVLRTGIPARNVEVIVERPDGSRLPVLVNFSAQKNAQGEITGAITSFIDIAERQLTEWNLAFLASVSQDLVRCHSADEMTRDVAAKISTYLHLSHCAFIEINEAADEAVVSHDWHREVVPGIGGDYRISDFVTEELQKATRSGEALVVRDAAAAPGADLEKLSALNIASFVCVPIIADGLWRFALVVCHSATYDWREDEIALLSELARRIWTRLERARAEEALRETKARLQFALDSAQVGDWDLDLTNDTSQRSPRHDQAFGYKDPVAEWGFGRFIQHVHPGDREGVERRFREAVAQEKDWHFECRIIWADGSVHWIEGHGSIYRTPEGQPTRMLGIVFDITGRRMLEATLVARAEELAQADRSKDEFLAMLAHELRNPLAPLRNAAEILQSVDAHPNEHVQAQRIVARQVENMSRMIDDLLDVSRITEGKIELRREPVTLEAILTAVTSLGRSACAARGQEVTVSMPAEPVFLNGDATRLEQVFNNLLGNACKYSGDGSHIRVTAERTVGVEPAAVVVCVRDDGVGIAPELLPRVFELFVQGSRSLDRAHGGLGIGLTLVQRLVKLHGGNVEARSEGLGHGSEFIVRLPILREAPPPPPPPPPTGRETPRRILIVDDNTDAARSLAIVQSRRGHETRTAFTGPEAVTIAGQFLPEVVLLDIGLPGMDGFEVARRLRAMPPLAGAFLVAMSGYGSPEDRALGKAAGFDEYMVKPVDLALLRTWLRGRV